MTNEELVKLYQEGNKSALDKLIEQNTGIVYKIANKFYTEGTSSIDKEDLEQEGVIGLMAAANKYDFNNPKKAKFTTYAIHWVYQKINRFVNQKNTNNEVSLNVPIDTNEEIELMAIIESPSDDYNNIDEQLYLRQLRNDLESAMGKYNTLREREVLKFRFGWDMKPMSMNEVGDIYGITGERVRQLQSRALRRLRNSIWVRENRDRFIQDGFMDGPFKGLYKYNW